MKLSLVAALLIGTLISAEAIAKLRIGTYNIRNFDYDERSHVPTNKNKLYETLKEMNFDFIAVQEINEAEIFENYIERSFKGRYGVVLSKCGGAHGQKLGFVYDKDLFSLVNFKEDLRITNPFAPNNGLCYDGSRPLAIGTFKNKKNDKVFAAMSVHLKSGGHARSIQKRFKQLELINDVIKEHKQKGIKNFVVMGDFNSTEYIFRGQGRNDFANMAKKMNLDDVTSDLSCTAYWWGGRRDGKQHPSQLDHILISGDFGSENKSSKVKATTQSYGHCAKLACEVTRDERMGDSYDEVSDHCPLVSTIE